MRELFDAVVEIESAQRAAFLDAHTQDDPQLRAEVERLLAADSDLQRNPRFQDAPVSPQEEDTRTSAGGRIAGENETIAGYRVLGKLGSGGMGVVYRAEQPHPRRQVALKLVRSDRVSPENLRRFSVETEVLGRLSHPNIAAIYDAGLHTDEDGAQRPYIVMELVAGRPLTEYVGAVRPTLRRRVELLVRVCDGLQHAHQNGIVHRDLKPGNILVDAEGNPKLVDFGIARPLFGELNVTLPETTPGEFIGTLAYMSPERLHGSSGPIDTRADVYSLGVVAYQTIAERMPLDLHGQVIAEVIRRIRDQQPRPLTFQGKPVDGDLQAVVRMALERDPSDRYASAAALGDDLRRFLAGEPVIARPPSLWRHLRSFVRRHRAAAAAIAAVVVVSIAAAITSTGFAISANRARAVAQLESEMRAAVNDFLLGAMFDWGDPEYAAGRRVTVLEVLDRAAERIARIENPQVRAEVLYALSVIYQAQGAVPRGPHDKRPAAHELALQLAREALETWR
ncbi:MAG: serine/threonine protein kinase, partial [Planctomycetota bacterium]